MFLPHQCFFVTYLWCFLLCCYWSCHLLVWIVWSKLSLMLAYAMIWMSPPKFILIFNSHYNKLRDETFQMRFDHENASLRVQWGCYWDSGLVVFSVRLTKGWASVCHLGLFTFLIVSLNSWKRGFTRDLKAVEKRNIEHQIEKTEIVCKPGYLLKSSFFHFR